MIEKLKEWVNENYVCVSKLSECANEQEDWNVTDVFWYGHAIGTSNAAYEIGKILGMDLPLMKEEGQNE